MPSKHRLGWQQVEVLRRCYLKPGMGSLELCRDLNISNRPHKRVQEHGLVEDRGDERRRQWHLTEAGLAELRRRDPALFKDEE